MSLARRLAAVEAARTAEALADFRGAFGAWRERPRRPGAPESLEEAEARVVELRAGLAPAELARSERLQAALTALVEPDTPPADVVRAAAVIAGIQAFALAPGAPPYLALAALAAHFRQGGTD